MKKLYFLLFALSITSLSFGQVLATDDFTYSDGPLVGNGLWTSQGGTAGTLLVASGEAVITQDGGSEDGELKFADDLTSGTVTATFDIRVTAPAAMIGTDFEYFAHFANDTEFNFRTRVDVIAPTAGGDYTLGLSATSSTNDASLTTDFSFGATVAVEISYNIDTGEASLTVGAETVTSAGSTGDTLDSFGLRQSSSSSDETIFMDNLSISYNDNLSVGDFNKKSFNVFPNPTNTGSVSVVPSSSSNFGDINVAVYDVLGKQVINKTMTSEKLNVSSLNTGVYIVKITQGNATSTKKLVIN